jgi:cell division protein FtsI (penicillin-binding protein 3)
MLLRPYLVQKVVAPDGAVLVQHAREELRRAISEDTSRTLTAMLEEVVRKGTGSRAGLVEYRAAGKTGTAQKVDPVRGGYSDKRLASFLGFVPADAPRVAILVVVDEPEGKGNEITGGTVAAPAWGAIARESLRQLGVMPDESKETVPALAEASASAPPTPAAVPEVAPKGKAVVPDLSGLGARSAIRRLAERSLDTELRGSGRAVAQTPRAGSIVKRGARVKVTLAPPG